MVVIGEFRDPIYSSVDWDNIGHELSRAFGRELVENGRFDVLHDNPLADAAIAAAGGSGRVDPDTLAALRKQYPDVEFVIGGSITDFAHTDELAGETSRRNLLGRRDDALVAIDLQIVDLKTGRMAISDHVVGNAGLSQYSIEEIYGKLGPESYLFWSTPLGKASQEALDECERRLLAIAPSGASEIEVINMAGWRELQLSGGSAHGMQVGQRYFVCVQESEARGLRPVNDPVLQTPLQAEITKVGRETSIAWVLGEPPANVNLRTAVLVRELKRPLPAKTETPIVTAVDDAAGSE